MYTDVTFGTFIPRVNILIQSLHPAVEMCRVSKVEIYLFRLLMALTLILNFRRMKLIMIYSVISKPDKSDRSSALKDKPSATDS